MISLSRPAKNQEVLVSLGGLDLSREQRKLGGGGGGYRNITVVESLELSEPNHCF